MHRDLLRPVAALSALAITWSGVAAAQQRPGTNAPTPLPASEDATSTPTAPILQEPYIDATSERSSLPNGPLLATGVVVLGASYGASVIAAARSESETDDKLYYPVVGPWLALNDRDCSEDPCSRKTLDTTLLICMPLTGSLSAWRRSRHQPVGHERDIQWGHSRQERAALESGVARDRSALAT